MNSSDMTSHRQATPANRKRDFVVPWAHGFGAVRRSSGLPSR
jgi:hypothetical protein